MNVEVSIDDLAIDDSVRDRIDEIKIPVQQAMAEVFEVMVKLNLGEEKGEFRPAEWSPLSAKYAKRVKRPYATLVLTHELENSVRSFATDEAGFVVSEGCDYAAAHQYGDESRHLPARPFFPMTGQRGDEEITPQAYEEVRQAAEIKINELLK